MTLDPSYKIENVITSLDKYLYDNLVTTEGLTIDWEGGDSVDIGNVDEWIQPRLMEGIPQYLHWILGNRIGQNTHFLYNINIFVKRGASSSAGGSLNKNRLIQLRDIVATYYCIGKEIDLMDYSGANTLIDKMIVQNIFTDSNIPSAAARIEIESTYYQWTYTPEIVVIQGWAK